MYKLAESVQFESLYISRKFDGSDSGMSIMVACVLKVSLMHVMMEMEKFT